MSGRILVWLVCAIIVCFSIGAPIIGALLFIPVGYIVIMRIGHGIIRLYDQWLVSNRGNGLVKGIIGMTLVILGIVGYLIIGEILERHGSLPWSQENYYHSFDQ